MEIPTYEEAYQKVQKELDEIYASVPDDKKAEFVEEIKKAKEKLES